MNTEMNRHERRRLERGKAVDELLEIRLAETNARIDRLSEGCLKVFTALSRFAESDAQRLCVLQRLFGFHLGTLAVAATALNAALRRTGDLELFDVVTSDLESLAAEWKETPEISIGLATVVQRVQNESAAFRARIKDDP